MILAVLAALILGGAVYLLSYFFGLSQRDARYEELKNESQTWQTDPVEGEIVTEPDTEQAVMPPAGQSVYDFGKLQEENGDIYAWITVPGTQIDYPVLQSETDDYYLDYNMDHTKGYPGCIYSNSCNTKDFLDYVTVLYGHNMKNGSMFGSLHKFEKETFFADNTKIEVYTKDRYLEYEIIAVCEFSDVYIPAVYGTTDNEMRDAFLADVKELAEGSSISHLRESFDVTGEDDRYLVLSTCINGQREKRYLLVGRLKGQVSDISRPELMLCSGYDKMIWE